MSLGRIPTWKAEFAAGLVLAAIGVFFVIAGSRLPPPDEPGIPGPGTAPFLLGLAIVFFGLATAIPALFRQERGTIALADRKQLIALASLVLGALLFERAGFVLSTFLFLSVGFALLGGASWRRALPAAGLVTMGLWYLFTKLLGVGLPYGVIGEILFR